MFERKSLAAFLSLSGMFLIFGLLFFWVLFIGETSENPRNMTARTSLVVGMLLCSWVYLAISFKYPRSAFWKAVVIVGHLVAFVAAAAVVWSTLELRAWSAFPTILPYIVGYFAIILFVHWRILRREKQPLSVATLFEASMRRGF